MPVVGKYHKEISANLEEYIGDLHVDFPRVDYIQLAQLWGEQPRDNKIFINIQAAKELRDVLNELLGEQQ